MTVSDLRCQLAGVDGNYAVVVNIGGLSYKADRIRLVPLEIGGASTTTVDGKKKFARVSIPALSIDAFVKD